MIPKKNAEAPAGPPKNAERIKYLTGGIGSLCDRCRFKKRCLYAKESTEYQTVVIACESMQEE